MAHHPKLLILDEATSGLDPVVRDEILDMFQEFIQDEEHSVLISSHITSDLEKVADYITFIHKGEIFLSEEKDRIMEEYGIVRCRPEDLASIDPDMICLLYTSSIVDEKGFWRKEANSRVLTRVDSRRFMRQFMTALFGIRGEGVLR